MSVGSIWQEQVKRYYVIPLIINSMFVLGVLFFAMIAIMVNDTEMSGAAGVLSLVSALFAITSIPIAMIASRLNVQNGVKKYLLQRQQAQEAAKSAGEAPPDPEHFSLEEELEPLRNAYQIQLIIGSAVLESAAFFAAIAYLVEKSYVPLIFLAALITALALRTPTVGKITQFLEKYIALGETDRFFQR
jgi:hypothetical protein